MLNPEVHTAHEMHELWFPHAPFEVVVEFWNTLHDVVIDDAPPEDWERHGRAYRKLQRYSTPTIDIEQL